MTLVGKNKLDHPALGSTGGAGLHTQIETMWTTVSDNLNARWQQYLLVTANQVITFEHNLKVPFDDLRCHVYSGSGSPETTTRLTGWTIAATSGYEQTKITVTAPSSGSWQKIYLYVSHEPMDDKLTRSGDSMTGSLAMGTNKITNLGTPTVSTDAANKSYVDTQDGFKVSKAGDSMTGALAMGNNKITGLGTPTATTDATTKTYVDTADSLKVAKAGDSMTGALAMGTNKITGLGTPTVSTDASTKQYVDDQAALKVSKAGDTMTGNLVMNSNFITNLAGPVNQNDAANKIYVDNQDALKVSKNGDSMTGALAMGNNKITGLGTPTVDTDASTKKYVDDGDALKLSLTGGTMSGVLNMGNGTTNYKISNVADPASASDAATKNYVDSVAQGLDPKASVKAATTANITLSAAQTVDGVNLVAGDRCLVKNQTTASQNGIYVVASAAWSRASDMDSWTEVPGAFVFVEQGSQADTGWVCSADQGGTIGTTAINWISFAGAGSVTAGNAAIGVTGTSVSWVADGSTLEVGGSGAQIKDLGVTAAKLAGSIPDSKLSTISTAGKVDGGAITSGTIGGSTIINSTGAITTTGALTVGGAAALNGGVTLGNAAADALTINSSAVTLSASGLNFDSNTLVIDSSNNRVGVGIASPTVALDVVGAAKISTTLTVNGNTTLGDAPTDTVTVAGDMAINGTGSVKVPNGTTAERPATPADGMIRYNSSLNSYEGYSSGAWSSIGGGGTIDRVTQAAHGFAVGDVLYLNGSTYTKALNTAATTGEVVGVVSRVVDSSTFEMTLSGEISGLVAGSYVDGSGVALGALPATGEAVFLSHVAGKLTLVEPTVVGSVSVPIGVTSGSGTLYVSPKRGVVVGGANARTQLTLANNTTATIQDLSDYDAGEVAGWIFIDATTDYRFYVQAQFVKGAKGNYNVSYQTSGDTPPAGFSLSMTNAGLLQYTMPNLAGFSATNSVINYALNAPAVGTNFPLSVDTANLSNTGITGLTGSSAVTASTSGSGKIGEIVTAGSANNSSFTALSYSDLTGNTLALTAGIWSITFETAALFRLSGLTGGNRAVQNIALCKSDNTILASLDINAIEIGQTPQNRLSSFTLSCFANLTASDTLKLRGRLWNWSGSESYTVVESILYTTQGFKYQAVRIA